MGGMPLRHHSVSDFDPMRSPSASNLQNFYAAQRFQPRHNEAEQMQQAKRRMAAQRERELRNYHQEQQYNRSKQMSCGHIGQRDFALISMSEISTQGKSERSISPSSANEEDRRELIARQHRALYGNDGGSYYDGSSFGMDSHTPRPNAQAGGASGSVAGGRGPSPLSYNSFGMNQEAKQNEAAPQYNGNEQNNNKGPSPQPQQSRSRANSNSSPASASNPQNFSLFENAQQSSRTSTSSPGGSPPRPTKASTGPIGSGVAPIGTRPAQGQAVNPALNKRSTTPLPSPLSYGFAPNETAAASSTANERSTSAASNPATGAKESTMSSINWGSSSGVWGKTPLGVWG